METTKWDTTRYLSSKEDIAAYLEAVFEDGDPALIAHALGEIARAEGMTHVAKAAGLSQVAVKNLERDRTDPRASTLTAIQEAFDRAGVVFLDPGDIRNGGSGLRFK